jgi:hypothetical protein
MMKAERAAERGKTYHDASLECKLWREKITGGTLQKRMLTKLSP